MKKRKKHIGRKEGRMDEKKRERRKEGRTVAYNV